ncbi:3-mercaptopyruvate sulfurtransferase [Protopterus annectens]|uniref:3-mercaptopyruvate sulfurtransferase n=1 Tax=Protopterus annectens TaxID=7888 RepID=UPI001CF9E931|nr:3-mercaptopyruvate sulfurtransferase [Protopterus annectens]
MQAFLKHGLVTTKWLGDRISSSGSISPLLRILDASWYLPHLNRNPLQEFQQQHIPGALFFDLEGCCDHSSPYEHMLPSAKQFAEYAGSLAVDKQTHVVVYDGSDVGCFSAPRVWWMFRVFGHHNVSVLDGGFRNWLKEGYPVTADVISPASTNFEATRNERWIKTFEEVERNLKTKEFMVVDARAEGRFKGIQPEPRQGVEPGHIPGSLNMPFYSFLTEAGTMKSEEELRSMFQEKNVNLSKPLVVTCGSGVTACQVALAAYLCGKEDTMVFDGAWCEWFLRAKPEQVVSEGKGKSL